MRDKEAPETLVAQGRAASAGIGRDEVLLTHNPKVAGSNPAPATIETSKNDPLWIQSGSFFVSRGRTLPDCLRTRAIERAQGPVRYMVHGLACCIATVVSAVSKVSGSKCPPVHSTRSSWSGCLGSDRASRRLA